MGTNISSWRLEGINLSIRTVGLPRTSRFRGLLLQMCLQGEEQCGILTGPANGKQ